MPDVDRLQALATAARNRAWRAVADAKRTGSRSGSARAAKAAFPDVRRRDVSRWIDETRARHDAYRTACPPMDDRVAIVCVSQRPQLLHQVVANVRRQHHDDIELIFVTNAIGFDRQTIGDAMSSLPMVTNVLERPAELTLGACLNAALAATSARFVAKFDDDDLYGPHYLSDALRAHRYAGAGVVGKHTSYAYLSKSDVTVMRFPTNEYRYSSTLAGGTLVIDRDRTGEVEFEDRSLGEDRAFVAACHRAGVSTFSADRFNYVQIRADDNTWAATENEIRRDAHTVGSGQRLDEVYR